MIQFLRRLPAALGAVLALLAGANHAGAAEIKVLTAGAFKPVLVALAPAFEQHSGHRVVVDNDTAGALVRRINGGEPFDLVLATPAALQQLSRSGRLAAGERPPLARVAIGVAVKQGAPQPDISSVQAFRQAVLAARAVAYIDPAAGGSSGVYLAVLFERLGLADAVRPKAVLVPGGLVAQRLLTGEADLAIHQISEILAVPGAVLVGPLPDDIQLHTEYIGAVGGAARDAAAARALLDWLRGPQVLAVLKDKGMLPP